jgi:hypothetical protein
VLKPRVAGKLTLVQVSTMSGQVNIFDVQTTPALMVMGGLKKLLESNIVKVSDHVLFITFGLESTVAGMR